MEKRTSTFMKAKLEKSGGQTNIDKYRVIVQKIIQKIITKYMIY